MDDNGNGGYLIWCLGIAAATIIIAFFYGIRMAIDAQTRSDVVGACQHGCETYDVNDGFEGGRKVRSRMKSFDPQTGKCECEAVP